MGWVKCLCMFLGFLLIADSALAMKRSCADMDDSDYDDYEPEKRSKSDLYKGALEAESYSLEVNDISMNSANLSGADADRDGVKLLKKLLFNDQKGIPLEKAEEVINALYTPSLVNDISHRSNHLLGGYFSSPARFFYFMNMHLNNRILSGADNAYYTAVINSTQFEDDLKDRVPGVLAFRVGESKHYLKWNKAESKLQHDKDFQHMSGELHKAIASLYDELGRLDASSDFASETQIEMLEAEDILARHDDEEKGYSYFLKRDLHDNKVILFLQRAGSEPVEVSILGLDALLPVGSETGFSLRGDKESVIVVVKENEIPTKAVVCLKDVHKGWRVVKSFSNTQNYSVMSVETDQLYSSSGVETVIMAATKTGVELWVKNPACGDFIRKVNLVIPEGVLNKKGFSTIISMGVDQVEGYLYAHDYLGNVTHLWDLMGHSDREWVDIIELPEKLPE